MNRLPVFGLAGAFLVLLGCAVTGGLWFQLMPLARVLTEYTPMVFSTALSFVLAGCVLFALVSPTVGNRRLVAALGTMLGLIALLTFGEHILQRDLGIDWPSLHVWLQNVTLAPGRMSTGSASGFLFCAAALLLAPRVSRPWMATATRLLTAGIGGVGILGLIGYAVSAPLLFPEYLFAGMAIHTCIGLVVLAIGLWSACNRLEWGRAPLFSRTDNKLTAISAMTLTAIALFAGIASFAMLEDRVKTVVGDNVLTALARRVDTFTDYIQLREVNARFAATRPAVIQNLRAIHAGRDDGSNRANVSAVVDSFLNLGFSGVAYYDPDDKLIASGGVFVDAPSMAVALPTPERSDLLWHDGFFLRHRIALRDSAGIAGTVRTEQPLDILTRLAFNPSRLGETAEVGVCVPRAEKLECFPQRMNARVYSTPLLDVNSSPSPMVRAVRGETGTTIARDYRRQNVIAAFGPVGNLGLGMVVKIDTAEVFRPVREQLLMVLLLLLFLVAGGTLLLRSQIEPVAAQLVNAEAHARAQERKFKALLDFAPDATLIVGPSGEIVMANLRAETLFGYAQSEMLGQRVEMLMPSRFRDLHAIHRRDYFMAPRVRGVDAGLEFYGRRKDGSEFPAEISLSPLETEEGAFASSAIRDITERKRIESALQEKNTELERANQTKDRFLASMSHELRTPLNAVLGFTGVLLMKLPGPLNAEQEKQLSTVRTSARHLLSLINDLLDLSKIGAGRLDLNREPCDCGEVVGEVVAALRPLADSKGLWLTVAAPDNGPMVNTDRRALSQIVINLVNNALKFTFQGGVRITVTPHEEDGRKTVAVSVEDTGIGIRKEDQARLFAAFERVESSAGEAIEGTGLGLHLSQQLARAMGATIVLESEYGAGSTFTLILPGA